MIKKRDWCCFHSDCSIGSVNTNNALKKTQGCFVCLHRALVWALNRSRVYECQSKTFPSALSTLILQPALRRIPLESFWPLGRFLERSEPYNGHQSLIKLPSLLLKLLAKSWLRCCHHKNFLRQWSTSWISSEHPLLIIFILYHVNVINTRYVQSFKLLKRLPSLLTLLTISTRFFVYLEYC